MELKDFVTETLNQIIDGVLNAQEHAKKLGGIVNPIFMQTFGGDSGHFFRTSGRAGDYGQIIEFDIALTVTGSEQAKGGVGVFLSVIGAGVQGQTESSNSTANRIKFSIPIVLPTQR